jgi:hypothetical protein
MPDWPLVSLCYSLLHTHRHLAYFLEEWNRLSARPDGFSGQACRSIHLSQWH